MIRISSFFCLSFCPCLLRPHRPVFLVLVVSLALLSAYPQTSRGAAFENGQLALEACQQMLRGDESCQRYAPTISAYDGGRYLRTDPDGNTTGETYHFPAPDCPDPSPRLGLSYEKGSTMPTSFCHKGCSYDVAGPVVSGWEDNGDGSETMIVDDVPKTADTCSGSSVAAVPYGDAAPETSGCTYKDAEGNCMDLSAQETGQCPSNTASGEYNGTQVCVPEGGYNSSEDYANDGINSEPTDDGGGDGQSDGGGSVDSPDHDGGGSFGGTTTGTGEDIQGPDRVYSGSGCGSPPACSGDAINCGIAREVWQNRCMTVEAANKSKSYLDGKTPQQADLESAQTGDYVPTEEMDISEQMSDFSDVADPAPDGACPAPRSLALGIGTYELSYQPMCDVATQLRPLALFLFTVIGGVAVGRGISEML